MVFRKIAPLLVGLVAVIAVVALACAKHPQRMVDFDIELDFSNKKNLAFLEDTDAGANRSPGLHRDLTRRAIKRELVASGHSFVDPSQADLLVVYHVGRDKRHTTGMIAGEVGSEDVMVISFRDPTTERSVWWGKAQLESSTKKNPEREIDQLTQTLLSAFPPPPGARSDYPLQQ